MEGKNDQVTVLTSKVKRIPSIVSLAFDAFCSQNKYLSSVATFTGLIALRGRDKNEETDDSFTLKLFTLIEIVEFVKYIKDELKIDQSCYCDKIEIAKFAVEYYKYIRHDLFEHKQRRLTVEDIKRRSNRLLESYVDDKDIHKTYLIWKDETEQNLREILNNDYVSMMFNVWNHTAEETWS